MCFVLSQYYEFPSRAYRPIILKIIYFTYFKYEASKLSNSKVDPLNNGRLYPDQHLHNWSYFALKFSVRCVDVFWMWLVNCSCVAQSIPIGGERNQRIVLHLQFMFLKRFSRINWIIFYSFQLLITVLQANIYNLLSKSSIYKWHVVS